MDNTLLDLHNSSFPTQPHLLIANYYTLAEFILKRRVIRLDGLSVRRIIRLRYKSEDEFCSIIRLGILLGLHDGRFGAEKQSCENIETSPSHVETSSKNRLRSV